MRIERLQLRDFRGFRELDLRFPADGPAVLIGANGAGKSSVLDCASMFLSHFVALTHGTRRQRALEIGPRDVRRGATTAYASIVLATGDLSRHLVEDAHEAGSRAHSLPQMPNYVRGLLHELATNKDSSTPVLCHYRPNRGLGKGKTTKKSLHKPAFPQLRAYERAFGRTVGPFQDYVRWFRFEEDTENEVRLRKDPAHRSRRLETVRRAVGGAMSLLPPGDFTNLRAERPTNEDGIEFTMPEEASLLDDKQGQSFALNQLSDGEKITLLLAADLAMRLAIANPGLEDPLRGKGIVLIDELELHLHPEWQRAVLPGLCSTFPGCQFIVTTHSPQVLSRVKPESVIILEDFKRVEVTPSTYGRDSTSILEDVMGVRRRPREAEDKIHQIAKLIDKGDLAGAKAEVKELTKWFGEQDSEIIHLNTLIKFMSD
jgi:hypothetical protein